MALAAPMIAAFIHSYCVYERGFRLYNAEIGGEYFHPNGTVVATGILAIVRLIGISVIPAIPTFLVLLPFRRQVLGRWIVWAGSIVIWTVVLFHSEIAFK